MLNDLAEAMKALDGKKGSVGQCQSTSSHGARCCFAQLNPLLSMLKCRLTIQPNRVNWHACLRNPRAAMRHKISCACKNNVCKLTHTQRTPEDTYALLQQSRPRGSVGIAALVCRWQTAGGGSAHKNICLIATNRIPCRRNQRARLQSHMHGLLLPKESAHPCRGPSQCNRTCSNKPTATAHTSERTTLPDKRTSTQLTQVARRGPRLNSSMTDLVPVQRKTLASLHQCDWASNYGQPTVPKTIDCSAYICWPLKELHACKSASMLSSQRSSLTRLHWTQFWKLHALQECPTAPQW